MEVRYLEYTGNKVGGNVIIRQEPRLSQYRTLTVHPGKRWEIGRAIPELTARRVIAQLSMLFKVVPVVVDDRQAIVRSLSEMYEKYEKSIGEGSRSIVSYAVVEALFSTFSKDAVRPVLQALKDAADEDEDELESIAEVFHDVLAGKDAPPSLSALNPVETAVEEVDENTDTDADEEEYDGEDDLDLSDDDDSTKGKKKKSKKTKKKK
jgi:hypothetical protein